MRVDVFRISIERKKKETLNAPQVHQRKCCEEPEHLLRSYSPKPHRATSSSSLFLLLFVDRTDLSVISIGVDELLLVVALLLLLLIDFDSI